MFHGPCDVNLNFYTYTSIHHHLQRDNKVLRFRYHEQINNDDSKARFCAVRSTKCSSSSTTITLSPVSLICFPECHTSIILGKPDSQTISKERTSCKQKAKIERVESCDIFHMHLPSRRINANSDDRIAK